jgi:hypothetical protein
MGWREPYVYFTAERVTADGEWVPAERERYSRCGVFDGDWHKDVVDLKPGERLRLGPLHGPIPPEFQLPGRVRVFGHYAYRAAGGKRGLPRPVELRGRMRGVPLFELTSEPIEFEVFRPLDVRVRVKGPMKANVEHRLSDVLDVTVVNLTPAAVPLSDPSGYPSPHLAFELDGTLGGWRPSFYDSFGRKDPFAGSCRNLPTELPTGNEVSLLGADRLDGAWEYPRPETVRVRASFRPGVRDKSAVVRSEWVDLRVDK